MHHFTKQDLIEAIKNNPTKKEAAKFLGVSYGTLKTRVNLWGLSKFEPSNIDIELLLDAFKRGDSLEKIAKQYNVSTVYVRKKLINDERYEEAKDDCLFKRAQFLHAKHCIYINELRIVHGLNIVNDYKNGVSFSDMALKYKTHKGKITKVLKLELTNDEFYQLKKERKSKNQKQAHRTTRLNEIVRLEKRLEKLKNSLKKT